MQGNISIDVAINRGFLSLPTIEGRFPVGVATFTTSVQLPQLFGSVKLKQTRRRRQDQPEHPLNLEEVAFTAYYPAEVAVTAQKGVPWLIRPINASLEGFSIFLGISKWLLWPIVHIYASFLKIPAYHNAPLLKPAASSQWPLVIFSHGLGGSRTAYSQFCSRLAASGKVALAIEHRDGTGIAVTPRLWDRGIINKVRTVLYLRESDVFVDGIDPDGHPLPLRGQQLAFRHHEIHVAYSTFTRFIKADPTLHVDILDAPFYDQESWVSVDESGLQRVRHKDQVMLAGHSFGGCTVLSLLSRKSLEGYLPIPVSRAVILDPWLEPLPTPGPIPFGDSAHASDTIVNNNPSLNATIVTPDGSMNKEMKLPRPRMLVINSETFTLWKDHYARLKEIISGWEPQGGHIMTIIGSVHVSFSDFPVLPVFRKKVAQLILDKIITISLAFLDDRLDQTMDTLTTVNMEAKVIGTKKDGKPKRKLVGHAGEVIIE